MKTIITIIRNIISLCLISFLIFFCWQHEVRITHFEEAYKPYRPLFERLAEKNSDYQSLGILDKIPLRREVLKESKFLSELGWSQETIATAYIDHLQIKSPENGGLDLLKKDLKETRIVASPAFNKLWMAEKGISTAQAKQKLHILLNTIGLQSDLSGQKSENLQFLKSFDDSLSPDSSFWQDLASLVQLAFPDDSLVEDKTFNRHMHQLRYIISAQQATWVRQHFAKEGESDAQALAFYLTRLSEDRYSLTESARYHNKVGISRDANGDLVPIYADNKAQTNIKILVNFHSEFILSESGHFLFSLDTENPTTNSIVNSASFNYANQNDELHRQLDVNTAKIFDPDFLVQTLSNGDKPFVAPDIKQQKDKKNPIYSRDGKSTKQLIKAARKKFKKLLNKYQKALADTSP